MSDGSVTAALFEPFDLTIHLGPDSTPWLSASSSAGFVHGVPRRGAGLPDLQTLLDLVYDYADAVQFAEPVAHSELSRLLGELVFGDPKVLQLFLTTRGVAADKGRQTLVRILASPHLAVLPWELLPDPVAPDGREGHRYLALAPDAHVVRLARGRTYPTRVVTLEAPLNLLIVLSSPTPQDETEDWLAFDIFEVKRNLLAELAPLVEARLLNVDVEDRPTLENLRRRIGGQRRGYHLFHYVGHALPDRLILEDRAGRRDDLSSAQLVELLRLCPDLRLALFAGCETARAAGDPSTLDTRKAIGWRDLLSLADYCVQEACPTVLGMQAVLPFCTERLFTRFFYQGIVTGYSVAEALRLARGAIHSDDRLGGDLLDWSVPTLFVGASEPGAVLPRMTKPGPPAVRKRFELKLGLQQRAERFFARDLALRQVVDLVGGLTRERVLLLSGPDGVGKTSLVDRALEELGDAVSHVLYVHLSRIAPEVAAAREALVGRQGVDVAALARLPPDAALDRLCRFVEELLRLSGAAARAKDAAWSVEEWWERLVEDMVRHRLVLVIDDLDVLERLTRTLLATLVARWIAEHVRAYEREGKASELVPRVEETLRLLDGAKPAKRGGTSETPFVTLDDLQSHLAGAPPRLLEASRAVLREFVEWVLARSEETPAVLVGSFEHFVALAVRDAESGAILSALLALERARETLGRALSTFADRRSAGRIVITSRETLHGLLSLPDSEVFEMRLAHLSWPETWRWIRRNLPGLVSFGDVYLSRLWARLGTRLDAWEELERRVLRQRGKPIELVALAEEVVPPRKAQPAAAPVGDFLRARGQRPLRIAVAGPHLSSPAEVAEALTRLATEHGIGGRVVVLHPDEAGTLAALIDEPTPFGKRDSLTKKDTTRWLQRVSARQPDIILLDYGGEAPEGDLTDKPPFLPQRALVRKLQHRSLLIAAGGNEEDTTIVTTPAAYPEVLAIGALDNRGQPRGYSPWLKKIAKPDLYMLDDLSGNPLAAALKPNLVARLVAQDKWGTSFSSLNAVGAAVLVWSILPELSPVGMRALLLEASRPIAAGKPPRALTVADAVALARRRVVERTLQGGPCSLETLSAITGVELRAVSATIRALLAEGGVVKLTSGRLERYQLN